MTKIKSKLHIFQSSAPWRYVVVPEDKVPKVKPGGWGSIPVFITIGKSTWRTSIFPLKKDVHFIPVKKKIVEVEDLYVGEDVTFSFKLA